MKGKVGDFSPPDLNCEWSSKLGPKRLDQSQKE